MLAAIDLTQRQAARVVEQALCTRAQVEVEPRLGEGALRGHFLGRQDGLLRVELHDHGQDWPLTSLVGAFCDVVTVLSGQMYRFSTCILNVVETQPQAVLLAPPDTVQVSNRRRYDRKSFPEPAVIQVWPADGGDPLVGMLNEIGMAGLGCCLGRPQGDDRLLIEDSVRVRFQLPGVGETFELQAVVCNKSSTHDSQNIGIGLEFSPPLFGNDLDATQTRLRDALAREFSGPARSEGDE